MNEKRAFTLIELLIVVAIIGILVLIVLPNFLNAQMKAKVARSQADIRSIVSAVMSYRVDNNTIPPIPRKNGSQIIIAPKHLTVLHSLTTPIPYISSTSLNSPFSSYNGYWYYNWDYFVETTGQPPAWYWNNIHTQEKALWMVSTIGPKIENPYEVVGDNIIMWMEYNPTNGIVSRGIIQQHGE